MWAEIQKHAVVLLQETAPSPIPAGAIWVNLPYAVELGFVWDGSHFSPRPSVISCADFLARLTEIEDIAAHRAAQTDAVVATFITQLCVNPKVDLTDAKTTSWVSALVSDGVLTAARAAVILTP
jgi:hypothetical protein